MNRKKLVEALIPKIAKSLHERGFINENEMLELSGEPIKPSISTDEIGEFFVIVNPDEDSTSETITTRTNIPDLLHKVKTGELRLENIRSIKKKEGSALRMATKMIKEFNRELTETRKSKLAEYFRKREGVQKYLDGYKTIYGDSTLEEGSDGKIQRYEQALSELDSKIADLQAKLKRK
jgi:hypothetical protein